jgi:hypothetical protein
MTDDGDGLRKVGNSAAYLARVQATGTGPKPEGKGAQPASKADRLAGVADGRGARRSATTARAGSAAGKLTDAGARVTKNAGTTPDEVIAPQRNAVSEDFWTHDVTLDSVGDLSVFGA